MSIVSNVQQGTNHYNFSIEKPTQSMNKKVLIEQSDLGLKISIKDGSEKIHQVEKWMIDGLPNVDRIPFTFFEKCSVVAKNIEENWNKVVFCPKLLGGMMAENLRLGGFPFQMCDLSSNDSASGIFYGTEFQLNRGESVDINGHTVELRANGTFAVDDVIIKSVEANGNVTIHVDIMPI